MPKKQQDNTLATVAYVLGLITGIIVLLLAERNDRYTRFHAAQSIFFHIAVVVVGWIISLLLIPFGFSPAMVIGASLIVLPLYFLAALVIWSVLIIKAHNGIMFKLPYIGQLAENLTKK